MTTKLGANVYADGTRFAVHSASAEAMTLCLFDGTQERQIAMTRDGDVWRADVPGIAAGAASDFGFAQNHDPTSLDDDDRPAGGQPLG